MRNKLLVLTVKKWLKSVYIYGSYREIKTGVSLFWTILYIWTRYSIGRLQVQDPSLQTIKTIKPCPHWRL